MISHPEWLMLFGLFEATNLHDRYAATTIAAGESLFDPVNGDEDVEYLEEIRAELYAIEFGLNW